MSSMDIVVRSPQVLCALMRLPGIGPRAAVELGRRGGVLGELLERASTAKAMAGVTTAGLSSLRERALLTESIREASAMLARSAELGVMALSVFDNGYPALLREIADAPPVLYVKGNLPEDGRRAVACIGTRAPSEFGIKATQSITGALSRAGFTIVSGLALGVDTLAHQAALDSGGPTVAVLANGLDSVYPKSNSRLAAEILARGGALVSELPLGTAVLPRNLVQRDRLQSGLALGTVVFQTDIKGGSMHTARFTLLQRRLLFAPVPGGRFASETQSRGIMALTQRSGRDLAEVLEAEEPYGSLLRSLGRPPAIGIRSKDDSATVIAELQAAAAVGRREPTQLEVVL